MAIPTDLTGVLSYLAGVLPEFALLAGAIALARWLVKGADALEADAKKERLKDISDLLKDQSFTSLGKLGASIVPFVFEKLFGSKALSIKFVSRSILASILFWAVLLGVRHAKLSTIIYTTTNFTWPFIPLILLIDWLSLAKAKLIISVMAARASVYWNAIFVVCDVSATLLLLVCATYLSIPLVIIVAQLGDTDIVWFVSWIEHTAQYLQGKEVYSLSQVWALSTMLTSAWVILLFVSVLLLKLITPLEYIRQFTLWWFDIDDHPLGAIARVAGALIVIGAFAIVIAEVALKAVRWGWMVV